MITIYKYDITDILVAMDSKMFTTDMTSIRMPRDAKILTVGMQKDRIVLWAEVNTEEPTVLRRFFVYGTGWPIDMIIAELKTKKHDYVGTVFDGAFVWHVYDGGEAE